MKNIAKNIALMICVTAALLLTGCTKSHILASEGPAEPIFETQEGIVLDWKQINEDMDEQFVDNEEFPMAVSVNYQVLPEKQAINMTLIVKKGTTPEDAVTFADAAVRYLNDEAATQDFSFERSSQTSYGGFFKKNDLHLIVMPQYAQKKEQEWLVDMDIPKGSDKKIVPKEEETQETTETQSTKADE